MTRQTFPWILWLAIWVHICFGLAVIGDKRVLDIAVLNGTNILVDKGMDHQMLGTVLIGFALSAAFGLMNERLLGRRSFLLVFPQYSLLVIALFSDIYLLTTGDLQTTVETRHIDFWVLFAVVNIMIGLAFAHSAAILERYWYKWTRV